MPLRLVEPQSSVPLRGLPMTQQLFLWSVRHVVCAAEDRRGVCPLVDQFFHDAGIPRTLGLIKALLGAISASACEELQVNIPCGAQVLPDEARLLQDLFASGPEPCTVNALRSKLAAGTERMIHRHLQAVAEQFDALDALRGRSAHAAPAAVH